MTTERRGIGFRANSGLHFSIKPLQDLIGRSLKKSLPPCRFIDLWLRTPNDGFGGLKPLEVIERGEVDRIWRMIYELDSGIPT